MSRLALVLSGGGARAAFQVGVLDAIAEMRSARAANPFPIVCGTSAGAINAAAIAAHAPNFRRGVTQLRSLWSALHANDIYRADAAHLIGNGGRWLASMVPGLLHYRPASLLDNHPLGELLEREIPFALIQQAVGYRWPERLFVIPAQTPGLWFAVLMCTVLSVAIPIKIWNSARIEHRLQEQEKLLMASRLDALASQINPHFLFNTLTSISSLTRSQPETARMLILKLSGLLRRLLRSQDHFVTLREELEAIDEYLDIESIRFGPQLTIEKHIDPATLGLVVPSMILQPLVENSIKHGLAQKLGEGRITIRSLLEDGHAIIDVIDNGIGIPATNADRVRGTGIGLRNVNERLRVIYGANYQLQLDSVPGEGTCARVIIPGMSEPSRIPA